MSHEDLFLSLHKEGLTANVMHERLVEFFGPLAIPYSTAMRPFEEGSENFRDRPPNLKHDA
jgi:hypothetical protein